MIRHLRACGWSYMIKGRICVKAGWCSGYYVLLIWVSRGGLSVWFRDGVILFLLSFGCRGPPAHRPWLPRPLVPAAHKTTKSLSSHSKRLKQTFKRHRFVLVTYHYVSLVTKIAFFPFLRAYIEIFRHLVTFCHLLVMWYEQNKHGQSCRFRHQKSISSFKRA